MFARRKLLRMSGTKKYGKIGDTEWHEKGSAREREGAINDIAQCLLWGVEVMKKEE